MTRETGGAETRNDHPSGVRPDRISVGEGRRDLGVREARNRFGGIDVPASLVGMLTALAMVVLLAGLIGAAIGVVGYQRGLKDAAEELSMASLIGGVITLFLAFVIGGWAAGRMARYDGPRNGAMTAVWTILLGAVVASLGAWLGSEYDLLSRVELPQLFSRDALTLGGIVSALLAVAAMLLGGILGGIWGERFHSRADATIVGTRRALSRQREATDTR